MCEPTPFAAANTPPKEGNKKVLSIFKKDGEQESPAPLPGGVARASTEGARDGVGKLAALPKSSCERKLAACHAVGMAVFGFTWPSPVAPALCRRRINNPATQCRIYRACCPNKHHETANH